MLTKPNRPAAFLIGVLLLVLIGAMGNLALRPTAAASSDVITPPNPTTTAVAPPNLADQVRCVKNTSDWVYALGQAEILEDPLYDQAWEFAVGTKTGVYKTGKGLGHRYAELARADGFMMAQRELADPIASACYDWVQKGYVILQPSTH